MLKVEQAQKTGIRIQSVPVPCGRVIAMSDVHGHARYLRGVLEKLRLTAYDALVIVGDLLEKGPENLSTLREVMRLKQTMPVYWVMGNCDPVTEELLDPACEQGVRNWIEMSPKRIFREMMAEAGMDLQALCDMDAFRRALQTRFAPELMFMRALPHVLRMGRYTFVHGGITDAPLETQSPYSVMKNDRYLEKGYAFDSWVVVGHWPTQLLNRIGQACSPHVERERRIVSIDGGCVLKDAGQLNAMVIPDANADHFSFESYDGLETFVATHAQAEKPPTVSILYMDCAVDVLERGGELCTVRLKSSGQIVHAPSVLLYRRGDEWRLDDYTDYELPVRPGDVLKKVYVLEEGVYAKDAQGRVGWYRKKQG